MNRIARRLAAAGAAAVTIGGLSVAVAPTTAMAAGVKLHVVARNLNNPRHLFVAPNGTVYVAEAGKGGHGPCAGSAEDGSRQCVGLSGSVTRINAHGQKRVLRNLSSVAGSDGTGAGGPAAVTYDGNRLHVVVQDTNIDKKGRNPFGPVGSMLGWLIDAKPYSHRIFRDVNFAKYEAAHNPDHGRAGDPPIDSDPYSVIPYRGGYAATDAAGNDLLWISRTGKVKVLAVFPTKTETLPSDGGAHPDVAVQAQSVPTSVAVGPDHALYVGELGGFPFQPGTSRVWRVVPGHKPHIFARGFTQISDIAFDRQGNLLVLEIATKPLFEQDSGPGRLIRVKPNGQKQVLIGGNQLLFPTGLGVSGRRIYISNHGIFPGSGKGPHGQVVWFREPLVRAAPKLSAGSSGPAVRAWQAQLDRLVAKSKAPAVNGRFDAATVAATKEFQRSVHHQATGVVDYWTRASAAAVLVRNAPVLGRGDKGRDVRTWQNDLDALVPEAYKVQKDGVFDAGTVQSTRYLQKLLGVAVTGRTQPETWAAVQSLLLT